MSWRKPYAFARWLFAQLPAEEREMVEQQEHKLFVVTVTAEMLARAEAEAEADPSGQTAEWFWEDLHDAEFFWRAEIALAHGFEVSIMVDP